MNTEQLETSNQKIEVVEWRPKPGEQAQTMQVQNLGQLSGWYQAFQKAYGHKPLYLKAIGTDGEQAWLPAFVVKRPFAGSIVSSMPFLDTGGPSASSEELNTVLVQYLIERAVAMRAKSIEIRSAVPLNINVSPSLDKVTLILELPTDSESLWKNLNAKVRNQVRKAERSGLSAELGGQENLPGFYRIYATNMRDLGSPAHSLGFFEAIMDAFGDAVRIAVVKKNDKIVGGLITLNFDNTVVVPWASSLREYFKLCPNMILYWEALKDACEQRYTFFDFGRSTRNVGTYRFKRQWGAEEKQLYWYTIPVAGENVKKLSDSDSTGQALVSIWQKLPLGLSMWLGPRVRKYFTQ